MNKSPRSAASTKAELGANQTAATHQAVHLYLWSWVESNASILKPSFEVDTLVGSVKNWGEGKRTSTVERGLNTGEPLVNSGLRRGHATCYPAWTDLFDTRKKFAYASKKELASHPKRDLNTVLTLATPPLTRRANRQIKWELLVDSL